ncbi:MAG: P-loop NTPase fold protein, partial [bacterium]
VRAVAVTPDGEEIVTGGGDGTARVWNRRSGEERVALRGHSGWVQAVAVTPEGEEIVTGGGDGTIRVWNRSTGRQVRGTDLGGMGVARPLAGLRSDEPSDVDLLGIGTEVEMMATLVAAASTEAPLAIGLLGDWGSGKSSFMRQMETQVQELADASANNLGQSEFVANVCQVRFNAWHYSDDQIWSGLVEHLFRALASGESDGSQDPVADPERAAKVGERLHEATAEYQQVNRDLNQLASKPRPVGRLTGLGSVGELVALPGILVREIWRDVRSSRRSLFAWLVVAAALAAAVAGFLWTRDFLLRTILAFAGLGAAVGKVWRPLKRLHAWLLDSAGRQKRRLEERWDEAHKRIATLRGELALVSASERLQRFVADRQGAADYTPYRGLLGLVYRDLRQLNENLKAALQEWESLKPPRPMPPLQRIVLYIDDLDRCPPKRVVEVLQAVHL